MRIPAEPQDFLVYLADPLLGLGPGAIDATSCSVTPARPLGS
jgi:hypothetical protein